MKSALERKVATIVDIAEQMEKNPSSHRVLFVEDGAVNRAFLVDTVTVLEPNSRIPRVAAYTNDKLMVTFPAHMGWRCVDTSLLELATGEDLERKDLQDNIARAEFRYKLAKEYKDTHKKDKKDKSEAEGEQMELALESLTPDAEKREVAGRDFFGNYV